MPMMRGVGVALVLIATALAATPGASFIFLGDTHFDRTEYHDAEYLAKPGHQNHARYTEASWGRLIDRVHALTKESPVRAIIQTGDLHEGRAATPEKQRAQQRDVLAALATERFECPWLLVKGNHDVTGPEAKAAYAEFVQPFMSREIARGHYSWRSGKVEIFAADCYDPAGLCSLCQSSVCSVSKWFSSADCTNIDSDRSSSRRFFGSRESVKTRSRQDSFFPRGHRAFA